MRNMGLSRLTLVDPPAYDPERARWMAPGCEELLANARIVGSLTQALDGVHHVVASTARHRRRRLPVQTPEQVAGSVLDRGPDEVTAILFGREDFGLDKAAVDQAECILRIPTPEHASLNLGQAVLVTAHALFEGWRKRGATATGRTLGGSRRTRSTASASKEHPRDRRADLTAMAPAVDELVSLLDRVGYTRNTAPEKVAATARQALQNAGPSVRQVEAIRGMVARLEWALDHPDVDWRVTRRDRQRKVD